MKWPARIVLNSTVAIDVTWNPTIKNSSVLSNDPEFVRNGGIRTKVPYSMNVNGNKIAMVLQTRVYNQQKHQTSYNKS
jgi:hypothetical protein